VKNDRVGGEYDGIFPECIGNVGYFLLWPKMPILLINHFLQINHLEECFIYQKKNEP
jgi:hypothetical protein